MKKIPTLFQRNHAGDHLVRNEVNPECQWVLDGEGVPTRKLDGSCCMIRDGKLYKRREVCPGDNPPADWEAAAEQDEETGKRQGWVPVGGSPEDRWHLQAFRNLPHGTPDRTLELCGPKVQGNPERELVEMLVGPEQHVLIPHGIIVLGVCPRDFYALGEYFRANDIEGIVWHRGNGDMAKLKGRDYGIKRGPRPAPS